MRILAWLLLGVRALAFDVQPAGPVIGLNATLSCLNGSSVNIDSSSLYVDCTNNRVGMGTAAPGVALDNAGSTTLGDANADVVISSGPVSINAGAPAGAALVVRSTSATAANGAQIWQNVSGTELMRVQQDGNVGIGTTSPGMLLDILAVSGSTQAVFRGWSNIGGGSNASGQVAFGNATGNQGLIQYSASGNTAFSFDNSWDNAAAVTQFRSRTSGTPVAQMTLLGSGNVGIGNTAPATKLHISSGTMLSDGDTIGFRAAPLAAQTISAGNTITANSCGAAKLINAGGAVTTDTTNTFTAPAASNAGCCMDVINVDTVDTITLDTNANFNTAAGADVVLTPCDTVRVCSDGTDWFQVTALLANTCS